MMTPTMKKRLVGHGGSGKHDVKRRSACAPSNQGGQSDIDSITLSFDSISIGTEHSGKSN